MLIGLGHVSGTGKDTVAKILVENHGFKSLAFAAAIRAVAYDSNHTVRRIVDLEGWETAKRAYPSIRAHLLDLGAACRRHMGERIWISSLFAAMDPEGDYVISDMRYRTEAIAVRDAYGILVNVTRPGVKPANAADRELVGYAAWDAEIANDGTLDDLVPQVAALVSRAAPLTL